ncbi:MAG: ABC-F family ATP-binding cassette domain-containing protein, partial [Caldilineaceae bacterium]|nr:ABC-F family ATP-binding cassette domain-containing protein [Caldilineaceae bacterium]
LLDEPTNHLDIPAQEVLQTVLEDFDGTILLVSHDRYLIDRLATQIWDLHDAQLNVFEGSYAEFVAKRRQDAEAAKEVAVQERSTAKQDQRQDRRAKNEERKRLRQIEEMENKVHALEAELESITGKLEEASRVQDVPRIQKLSSAYAQTQTALERAMEAWAELATE